MIAPILAAALALAPQTPLSGSSDTRTEADFRCYTAFILVAGMNAEDPEVLNAASMIAFYYLGRLEGRDPAVDWVSRSIEVGNTQPDLLFGDVDRCAAEFQAKSQELIDKGEASLS